MVTEGGTVIGARFAGNLSHVRVGLAEAEWTIEVRARRALPAEGSVVDVAWRPGDGILLK